MALLGLLARLLARGRTFPLGVFLSGTRRRPGSITSLSAGLDRWNSVEVESRSGTLWRWRNWLCKHLKSGLETGPAAWPGNRSGKGNRLSGFTGTIEPLRPGKEMKGLNSY